MTTKAEMTAKLKLLHPTLKKGSDETGYEVLSAEEYEATISEWVEYQLEKEAKAAQDEAEAKAVAQAKIDAVDKLTALGIDPKALGL